VFLVIPLSGFQPFCDKIDIPFGRPDAGRRLLLERVQDVHALPRRASASISSGVVASRFSRSSGSVFDGRTLKCQSGYSTEMPSSSY
jgi:hypothetical protein